MRLLIRVQYHKIKWRIIISQMRSQFTVANGVWDLSNVVTGKWTRYPKGVSKGSSTPLISKDRSHFRAESSSLVKARRSPWSRSRQFFRCRLVGHFHWRYLWSLLMVRILSRFGARVLTGSSNTAAPVGSSAIAQSREIPAQLSSKRIRTRRRRRPSCLVDWSFPQVTPPLCATRHEPITGKR